MLEVVHDHPATDGLEYYRQELKSRLEPAHNGEFVAIDAAARLYALGKTPVEAHDALKTQGSTGWQVLLRVGSEATIEMFTRR
jgi:hypothetical protein